MGSREEFFKMGGLSVCFSVSGDDPVEKGADHLRVRGRISKATSSHR